MVRRGRLTYFYEKNKAQRALLCMGFYRRHLPHWHPTGRALSFTWRLHSSIEHERYLVRPDVAQTIIEALQYSRDQLRRYDLHAWCIMSNHVHILIHPLIEPSLVMKTLKGFTARRINEVLERTGKPLWSDESFDHWIRSETEFRKIVGYIESNPVRAGLVTHPADYPYSSASRESQAATPDAVGQVARSDDRETLRSAGLSDLAI